MATSEPRRGRRPLRPVEWAAIAGAGVVAVAVTLAATGVLDIAPDADPDPPEPTLAADPVAETAPPESEQIAGPAECWEALIGDLEAGNSALPDASAGACTAEMLTSAVSLAITLEGDCRPAKEWWRVIPVGSWAEDLWGDAIDAHELCRAPADRDLSDPEQTASPATDLPEPETTSAVELPAVIAAAEAAGMSGQVASLRMGKTTRCLEALDADLAADNYALSASRQACTDDFDFDDVVAFASLLEPRECWDALVESDLAAGWGLSAVDRACTADDLVRVVSLSITAVGNCDYMAALWRAIPPGYWAEGPWGDAIAGHEPATLTRHPRGCWARSRANEAPVQLGAGDLDPPLKGATAGPAIRRALERRPLQGETG